MVLSAKIKITFFDFLSRSTLLSQRPALRHVNRKMPKINTQDALGDAIRCAHLPKIPKIITHLINLNMVSRDASASENMWRVSKKFWVHNVCFEFVFTFQCFSMTTKYWWKDTNLLLQDLTTKCQSEQRIFLEIPTSALTPPRNNHKKLQVLQEQKVNE